MRRRTRVIIVAGLLLSAAGAYLWSHRPVMLALERENPVLGRLFVANLRQSSIRPEISGSPALLETRGAESSPRAALLRAVEAATGETVDFGFGGIDGAEVGSGEPRTIELPPVAAALLRAQDNPLLILHTRQPGELARVAARRGWLGPLAAEVFASAQGISVALDEDTAVGWLRVTLALEFVDGEAAEQGLRRLSSANGDYGQLGFVAQPGYERIVRRTRLVVIRLDARSESAARQLPRR